MNWRNFIVGLLVGGVLFSGVAVAQSYLGEVSQGQGGKKGAWLVESAGGTHALGAETLVAAAAATAMPTAATAKSYTFFNTGPDAIYCGFANTVTVLTGLKVGSGQGVTFDFAAGGQALYCITTVLQVAGTGTRVVLSTVANSMRIYGGGGGGGSSSVTAFAPGVPGTIALSASTSGSLCGLTAGSDYELSCSVDVAFRHGAATPTALLTDNQLRAGAVRTPIRMPTGSTCFAAISTSAGTCYISLIPTS